MALALSHGTVYGTAVADATPAERAAFLNRVYITVCGGLAIAMGTAFAVARTDMAAYMLKFGFMGWMLAMALILGATFLAHSTARVPVLNVVSFAAMTAVMGAVALAPMFWVAQRMTGTNDTVWSAFGLTMLVFGGLTMFVMMTGKDFTYMGGALVIGVLALLGVTAASFLFQSPVLHLAITGVGIVLFSLWILYDTSVILRTHTTDMWMVGAISLFVDFINLFVRILSLMLQLTSSRN